MKCMEIKIKVKGRNSHVDLMDFCDIHAGNIGFAEDELKKNIKWLKETENAYGILGGDSVDMITLNDKRFDVRTVDAFTLSRMDDLVIQQAKRIIDLFTPVKHKLLMKVRGNHEETIHKRSQVDICNFIATHLGIPCGENDNFINLVFMRGNDFDRRIVTIYLAHQIGGGGSTTGAKINKLVTKSQSIQADIYMEEHVHEIAHVKKPRVRVTIGGQFIPKVIQDKKLFVINGSYLKTHVENTTTYSEIAGYHPVELGNPIIRINPFPKSEKFDGKQITPPAAYGVVDNEVG